MPERQKGSWKVLDVLRAANKRYPEGYLARYYDDRTGSKKRGAGDTLAGFVVSELRESFRGEQSRKRQVSDAIQVLERAQRDIQTVIDGLREL